MKKFCSDNDIQLIFFPAKTASELSPLNNSYFSQLKALIRNYSLSTFREKQQSIDEVTEDISHENVHNYFIKCDLITKEQYVEEDTDCFILSESFDEIKL